MLAPPGSGKGDAVTIGAELLPVDEHVADQLPIGSGEGLAEVLFDFVTEEDNGRPNKVKRQVRYNAFVNIDEGDAWPSSVHATDRRCSPRCGRFGPGSRSGTPTPPGEPSHRPSRQLHVRCRRRPPGLQGRATPR